MHASHFQKWLFCYVKRMKGKSTVPRNQMFATSLSNGLQVLTSFKVGEPALTNLDLSRRTGLSKASISRITGSPTPCARWGS